MTTIIYRDGVLIADTAVFDRGCYCGEVVKIFKRDDGTMFGVAGAIGDLARFRDWMLAGETPDAKPTFDPGNDSEAIVIRPDGSAEWWGAADTAVPIVGAYHTIGSGFLIAMGALAHGATAEEAADICADLDSRTQRPFTVLRQ